MKKVYNKYFGKVYYQLRIVDKDCTETNKQMDKWTLKLRINCFLLFEFLVK